MLAVECRRWFFDRPAVTRAVDAATRRVLARFGSMVMRRARWSMRRLRVRYRDLTPEERRRRRVVNAIRRRRGLSPLPLPRRSSRPGEPPAVWTGALKRGIRFAYEPRRRSVVVGPLPAGPRTADVLEYGGWTRLTVRPRRRIRVRARPYMRPALEALLPRLPEMWRDSVRPRR